MVADIFRADGKHTPASHTQTDTSNTVQPKVCSHKNPKSKIATLLQGERTKGSNWTSILMNDSTSKKLCPKTTEIWKWRTLCWRESWCCCCIPGAHQKIASPSTTACGGAGNDHDPPLFDSRKTPTTAHTDAPAGVDREIVRHLHPILYRLDPTIRIRTSSSKT